MALKSNQNAILSGYIDAFCLICESLLTNEEEAERHKNLRSHIKNLESTQLVEKFKDDQILKVKQGYYCMICNLLFTTMTKVGLHVVEKEHISRKGSHLLKRSGSVIRFGDVVIDERAWQGLVGDMCAVCNVDFEDETEHLADSVHALNLVKNRVEFDGGQIYRKIDDTTIQCLTCNSVLPLNDVDSHSEGSEHKNLLLKSINNLKLENVQTPLSKENKSKDKPTLKVYESSTSSSSEGFNSAEGSSDESVVSIDDSKLEDAIKELDRSDILESVSVFEKNEVNINFESETALCKKCLGNVDFEYEAIERHIEEHKRNPKKRDVSYVAFPCEADTRTPELKSDLKPQLPAIARASDSNDEAKNGACLDKNHNEMEKNDNEPLNESPAEFAKRNTLTYNSGNNNAYCRLCLTRVPASLRSMKEHVAGNAHRNKVAMNQSSSTTQKHVHIVRKTSTEAYLDEVLTIENVFLGAVKVVNEKFCIGATSYHLITVNGDRLRCQVCEVLISRAEMSSHVESYCHERAFKQVPVVYSFAYEFVRELVKYLSLKYKYGLCNNYFFVRLNICIA
ncbi:hypothetical protein ABMA28_009860 [Loxostege sticticalis]|uniref:C2H2-type domain-containing protein n=1 Tax=Loxostege sticticalis TaxID=481309 RepID=A0ABD0SBM6_LOXSC